MPQEIKNLSLFLVFMTLTLSTIGQIEGAPPKTNFTVTPLTPEAEAIKKNQTDFVDYSKGTISVRIPLGQLPVEGYSWPWMLSYSTKGIKVNEIASNVGLGWSFNGVGTITAKMIGQSDLARPICMNPDTMRREFNLASQAPYPLQACSYYSTLDIYIANSVATLSTLSGGTDYLPDIFFLNIGQLNHKFFLVDTIGYTIPASNIKIRLTRQTSPYTFKFTITDEEGVIYYLSVKGSNSFTTDCPGQKRNMNTGNAVFYLDSLRTAFGDLVKYYYSDQYIYYESTPIKTRNEKPGTYQVGDICAAFEPQPLITCESNYNAKEARLDSVVTSQGSKVIFTYASRSDLQPNGTPSGSRMTGFSIYNDSREIKKVVFQQDCFGPSGSSDPNLLRLKLNKVQFVNPADNNDVKEYTFSYNSTALPSRISYAQDSAGYYNGQNGNTSLIPYFDNRSFSEFYTKAGILEKITYPEGGSSRFEYELNTTGEGGLRVRKVVDSNGITNAVRKYTYTLFGVRKIYNFDEQKMVPFNRFYESVLGGYYGFEYCPLHTYYSTPTSDITASYEEESSFYSTVEEYFGENGENGKKVYYYSLPDQYPYASIRLNPVLVRTEIYKKTGETYQFRQAQINQYSTFLFSLGRYDEPSSNYEKRLWGQEFRRTEEERWMFANGSNPWPGTNMCMPAVLYQTPIVLISQPLLLISTTDSIYTDNQQLLKTVTTYQYDRSILKPHTVSMVNSRGDQKTIRYKYSGNFSLPSATTSISKGIRNLQLKNINTAEIERSTFIQTGAGPLRLLNSILNVYDEDFPKVTKLLTVERQTLLTNFVQCSVSGGNLVYDNRYEEQESISVVGARANTLEYSRTNDLTTSVHWDKYNIYPVAKVSNSTLANTAYTSFEDEARGNWSYTGTVNAGAALTGKKSYSLSGGAISKSGLNTSLKYIVSYWSNSGAHSVTGSTTVITGKTISPWTYYEHLVTGVSSITVSGTGLIDELRLYPQGSMMTTFNYEHLVGLKTQTNERNNLLKYEYDAFNRLLRIRDEDNNILKQFEYKFQSVVFSNSCATIPNWQDVRTECGTGGALIQFQVDINPCSLTYNTERSIVIETSHPPCLVCTGPDKKVINDICETGQKKTTASVRLGPTSWQCTYHYEWSDGSSSPDYTEITSSPCLIL